MVTKIAMASPVRIIATASASTDAVAAAWAAIRAVESSCNRFDPSSELSLLNAHSREPVAISPLLCDLVGIALAGYRSTNGRFDPRVLSDLERMGYDRTFRSVDGLGASMADRPERADWTPEFDSKLSLVTLGGERIDLGGVAKGAAADRGLAAMAAMGVHGLIDIGGDGAASGPDEIGAPWSVGVEDPLGGSEPVAVLTLEAGGYATSSTRLRHWKVGGEQAHHLIDPRTGRPGGAGLRSVTVLSASGATAEVEAKGAFLSGAQTIAEYAARRALACLWVDDDGDVGWSEPMAPSLIWMRS